MEIESEDGTGGHYVSGSELSAENRPMAVAESRATSEYFCTLFRAGTVAGLSDGELLARFAGRRDEGAEAAFAALVERHGSMVLRVCRAVLDNRHDAEDAFQATFLVLALRAGAVRNRDSLASWLYGVALRAATKAKVAAGRRRRRERLGAELAGLRESPDRPEGWSELHDELDRLPEKYRAPIVLCYLGGLTHQEAADQLRLPLGTVKVRLSRARERLRGRLSRRGLAPALVVAGAPFRNAVGAVPTPLVKSTVRAAVRTAAVQAAGVSAPVAVLVKEVLKAMFLTKLKTVSASLAAGLTVFVAAAFVVSLAPRPARSDPPPARPAFRDDPRRVVLETLRRSDFGRTTTQVGTVEASESVDLTPGRPGRLQSLKADLGFPVKRGQVAAELDAAELAAELETSEAQVVLARTRMSRAQAGMRVAEASLEVVKAGMDVDDKAQERSESTLRYHEKKSARYKELLRKNAATAEIAEEEEQQVETARTALAEVKARAAAARARTAEANARREAAKADIEEATAELRVAEAGLRKARLLRESAAVVSPLNGIVGTGKIRVAVDVPDRDGPLLDKGDRATVRLDAIPGREFQGTVSRTAFAVDPAKQTLRAEIELEDTDGRVRPGQTGAVTILLQNRSDVLSVPAAALVGRRTDGVADCYRVMEGHAVLTRVKTGAENGTRVEVLGGLREGDTVIADPGTEIKDGQAIEAEPTNPAQKK